MSSATTAPSVWPDEANDVFGNVIKDFRGSLGSEEKRLFQEFNRSKDMLDDLFARCKDVRNGRKLSSFCKKIERFAAAWEPFFEVTNLFVQSHPEFAGIAWGAIRLVFLLGTNYTVHLEKIVTMIQRIGEALPAYEEYFGMFLRRRKSTQVGSAPVVQIEARHHRLYKALAYVYADVVQFCQEACNIFGKKKGGIHYKPSLISDLFWKPFDARFSELLERLQTHQEVFRSEMQLEESKYLELQNEKRARQTELTGQALQQIEQQVENLRVLNQGLDFKISAQTARLETFFRRKISDITEQLALDQREKGLLNAKVRHIKEWIDAPEYMREFDRARKTLLPQTGEYILEDHVYQCWKTGRPIGHQSLEATMIAPESPQTLFVKGKPGYGKTVLSSLLIRDLQECSIFLASGNSTQNIDPVLFYHFSSERKDCCGPYYALRAVLAQFVHRLRFSKDMADKIAVLMDIDSGGQLQASDEEVAAALSLLLKWAPGMVLVFDAVDECDDSTRFLELLQELSASSYTKLLLLSRPSLEIPRQLQHLTLYLQPKWNLPDIRLYLEPELQLMQGRGFINSSISASDMAGRLATRAEGMFLWAYLIIQYLNCRALSPKERLEAILETGVVEGLNNVYGKILQILGRGYLRERENVRKIFGLLVVAFRPLLVTELQFAVAINPGTVTEPSNLIAEFQESLPIICGALVEVQEDNTVRFIHSSFRDLLVSTEESANSGFSVHECEVHLCCATIALSYILYDLPPSPLCSSTRSVLRSNYPFIDYAQQWVRHATASFQSQGNSQRLVPVPVQDSFHAVLATFISRPLGVTVWIEASRYFGVTPSLEQLMNSRLVAPQDSGSAFNNGVIAVTLLKDLATDIDRLNLEWGYLLDEAPSAIWGPSITAFSKSTYWFETRDTKVSSLLPTEDPSARICTKDLQRPILIQSQVSSSGDEIGIVMVIPARCYISAVEAIFGITRIANNILASLTEQEKLRLTKICSSGWKVWYQRRELSTEKVLMDFRVDIPGDQVFSMLEQCITSKTPDRFPFPVAFSHDLDTLVVLRSLLLVRRRKAEDANCHDAQCRLQSFEKGGELSNPRESVTFYPVVSPDAKAVAFVSGSLKRTAIDRRRVEIWSESHIEEGWPIFRYRGYFTSSRLSWEEAVGDPFAFHPFLPLIVFSEWNQTAAWFFNESGPMKRTVLLKWGILSLEFSSDGSTLYHRSGRAEVRTSRKRPYEGRLDLSSPYTILPDPKSYECLVEAGSMDLKRYLPLAMAQSLSDTTSRDLSHLEQRSRRINPQNGLVAAGPQVLAYLPRLRSGEITHISLLPSTENDEWIRMIWNQGPQETYSIDGPSNPHLPSIIYRRRGAIEDREDLEKGDASIETRKKRRIGDSDWI
ncbi:hypothetical protein BCR34DRAFT_144457 [Clohesyomyces aquaticus]|uniref:Uncharacterized protein n=1 Tax=Clohesyomyces aquaticus TaxID=1231657 RepID=A0A1Y2A0G5_9PLEO|nr:hypothetical protein BCR34DRAFT_144457 [Clohesyomyces aquaticus]